MARNVTVDWESVKTLYRLGNLSFRAISDQYKADHYNSQTFKKTVSDAAIIKKVKAEGWKKDLAHKVKERVKETLIRSVVRDNERLSDTEIINEAADVAAQVVVRHRKEIKGLLEHENRLLSELADVGVYITKAGKDVKNSANIKILKDKSKVLSNIAKVRAQRIILEREAYNLESNDYGSQVAESALSNMSNIERANRIAFLMANKK